MTDFFRWWIAVGALGLGACASEGHYACPVPEGAGGCKSVAEVYRDTLVPSSAGPIGSRSLPPAAGAPRPSQVRGDGGVERIYAAARSPAPSLDAPTPGDALISTPRVLRVLVTPWQDDDGDLQAGGLLYLRMDQGQWTISR